MNLLFVVLIAQIIPFPGSVALAPTAVPPSYSGPGDVIPGAFAWWGLRAYSAATAGSPAANVCNSGDAVCANVNTLANGNFDVATATGSPLNCGGSGGTCTVKKLYDQTVGGHCTGSCDVVQATIASRPTLRFNCLGSLPCMTWTTTQFLQSVGNASAGQPFSISAVAKRTALAGSFAGIAWSGDAWLAMASNSAFLYAWSVLSASALDNQTHAIHGCFKGAGVLDVDGVTITGALAGAGIGGPFGMGFRDNVGTSGLDGTIAEAGWWASDISSSFAALNANQHAYWGF